MKKFLSLMLALLMVMSLSTVAWAAPNDSAVIDFNFTKTYVGADGKEITDPNDVPKETLEFDVAVKAGATNPDTTMISVADHTVAGSSGDVVITIPSYNKIGKWNYTVSEKKGSTPGVTYSAESFDVQVMVAYEDPDNSEQLVATVAFTKANGQGGKVTGIVNKFESNSLKVSKVVKGNLGSKTQAFDIDVTLKASGEVKNAVSCGNGSTITWTKDAAGNGYTGTVTLSIAHGNDVTISNIPAGVTYTVAEQAKHLVDDATGNNPSTGYDVKYTGESGTIAAAASEAVVINNKGVAVDTGITLDSLPYILLLGLAVAGLVLFAVKRRSNEA